MTNTLDITLIVALATLAVSITTLLLDCIRARKAEREKIVERTDKIIATSSGDWPYTAVTVTNVGLTDFTINRIFIDVRGKKFRVNGFTGDEARGATCPKFFPHGASLIVNVATATLDEKPVDVVPRIVLELADSRTIEQPLEI